MYLRVRRRHNLCALFVLPQSLPRTDSKPVLLFLEVLIAPRVHNTIPSGRMRGPNETLNRIPRRVYVLGFAIVFSAQTQKKDCGRGTTQ